MEHFGLRRATVTCHSDVRELPALSYVVARMRCRPSSTLVVSHIVPPSGESVAGSLEAVIQAPLALPSVAVLYWTSLWLIPDPESV